MLKKKILFVTGTRADFGKLKTLMTSVCESENFECHVFVTGMHMLAKYGNTVNEVRRAGFQNIFMYQNQVEGDGMDMILGNTIHGLSRYLHENPMDLIVVHGDRVEALAGAATGALRNVLVAHVEGGEISGTIDELVRHAVSKLSHVHYVASEIAKKRLLQLGELDDAIFHIGSPDIDVMLSEHLPPLDEAKTWYDIPFDEYNIAMLHPVTTESDDEKKRHADIFVESLIASDKKFIVVFPNNDDGCHFIFDAYQQLEGHENFRLFPSLRFEYFLTLLKNCQCIVGNSSAGVHESPVYGVPTVNVGSRQKNRFTGESVINVAFSEAEIVNAINKMQGKKFEENLHYGNGKSAENFFKSLTGDVWSINAQKQFKYLS